MKKDKERISSDLSCKKGNNATESDLREELDNRIQDMLKMRGGVTDAGQPTNRPITGDRATQPMEAGG